MPNSSQKTRKHSSAQAMLEFALALPVLLLVVYGLIETGRLLFMYASVVTAARQAARYGSATGDNGSGTRYYNDCSGIMTAARRLEFIQRFNNITIAYDRPGSWSQNGCPITATGHPQNGDRIRVSVSSIFTPIVPLVPLQPFTITSTSNRTLLVGSFIALENPGQGYQGSGTEGFVLTKWANTDYYYHVGDVITYHYTIQNTGTTPIDGGFWILDNKIPHSDARGNPCMGAPSPLPGPSNVITCPDQTYTITAADIISPEVTNHARASNDAQTTFSNEAVYTVSFVPEPHITLSKAGALEGAVVDAGKNMNYTFTILNDGNVPLSAPYTIDDTLIPHDWSCPSDALPVGGTIVCTGTYTLKPSDISSSFITNTATASAMNKTATVTSEPVTVENPIPVLMLNSITTNLPEGGVYTALNQVVKFYYSYTNRGTKTLSNLSITSDKFGTISCPGTVAADETRTCEFDHAITQEDLDAGGIPEGAVMQGSQSAPSRTWTSNKATILVMGTQAPAVTITITANPASPTPGPSFTADVSQIAFSFTFQNTGNIRLKGPYTITLDDARLGTITCSGPTPLNVLAFATCNPKGLTVSAADIARGTLVVHGSGTAFPNLGTSTVTPGTAFATVITYTLPRLALVKTPNKANFVGVGDLITYSYGLQNTGGVETVALTAFQLNDDKLGPVNCPAGTIGPGAILSCGTLNYTTTDTDVANLVVTNKLSVVSGSGAGTPSGTTAPVANNNLEVKVPLLRCDSSTLLASTIPDGTNTIWQIQNKTGTVLHITGGWMRWNNPVQLTQITFAGQPMNASGSSILLLPSAGWAPLPYSLTTPTTMALKFSGTASSIKIYLTFQETFSGLSCTLQSSP